MRLLDGITAILILILVFPHTNSYSQELTDSTSLWEVETEDGNTFIGTIVDEDSSRIILLTEIYGRIQIPSAQIKTKELINKSNLIGGEFWFDNPHATRYFFMTMAMA